MSFEQLIVTWGKYIRKMLNEMRRCGTCVHQDSETLGCRMCSGDCINMEKRPQWRGKEK